MTCYELRHSPTKDRLDGSNVSFPWHSDYYEMPETNGPGDLITTKLIYVVLFYSSGAVVPRLVPREAYSWGHSHYSVGYFYSPVVTPGSLDTFYEVHSPPVGPYMKEQGRWSLLQVTSDVDRLFSHGYF